MCFAKDLPANLVCFRKTATFDQGTVPAGLLSEHRLKAGSWGRIVVLSGEVDYVVDAPAAPAVRLRPEVPGVIAPGVPHHLELCGPVRFLIEFLRVPKSAVLD